jgi:hypothetical protein
VGGGISLAFSVEVIVQGVGLEKPLGLAFRTKALTRMLRIFGEIVRDLGVARNCFDSTVRRVNP